LIPRFERGERSNVFLTDSTAIDELIKRGKVVGGRTETSCVPPRIGIARAQGRAQARRGRHPKRSSAALLAAKKRWPRRAFRRQHHGAHIQGVFQRHRHR